MIRAATLGDLPGIYVLGKRIHLKSDDRDVTLDEAKARTTVASCITHKNGLALVDEVDGMVTGVLVGFVEEMWWSKRRYAIPLLVYAERPGAAYWMLCRFIKWAFEQKCAVQVTLDCSFGGPLGAKIVAMLRRACVRRGPYVIEEVGASFSARERLT